MLMLINLEDNFYINVNSPNNDSVINIKKSDTRNEDCCNCDISNRKLDTGSVLSSTTWNRQINYSVITSLSPSLNSATTLTRLGSDISFDLSSCPSDSVMRSVPKNFTPLHLDCPTLFIVGARKAGTSSLYQYVSKHPDFEGTRLDSGPKVGETFFFSSHYKEISWNEYLKYFPSDGVMTGESSVGNLVACESPKRVFESCGKQAKIIMLFRNPLARFQSNFLMRARLQIVRTSNNTSISTVIKLHLGEFFKKVLGRNIDITRLPEQWTAVTCAFDPAINLVYEGVYYVHLMNWLCNFPRENIMIINSEEFYNTPSAILKQVIRFIGLKDLDNETYDWITSNIYNRGEYNIPNFQKMSKVDKKKLSAVFSPLNVALFSLLNWNNESINWD